MAVSLTPTVLEERRENRRYDAAEHQGTVAGRVRPGFAVQVIDISAGGVYVETACRLLPGAKVDMQLHVADRRVDVRGRVLRCAVARLGADGVSYRGAIRFDRHLPWPVPPHEYGYGFLTENPPPSRESGERDTQTPI